MSTFGFKKQGRRLVRGNHGGADGGATVEQVRKVALTFATKGMTKWQDLARTTTEEVVSWFPEPTTRIMLMKMPH